MRTKMLRQIVRCGLLAFLGVSVLLSATALTASPEDECPVCDGSARIACPKCDGADPVCADCEGKGASSCLDCLGTGASPCPRCEGKAHDACSKCDGDGKTWVPKRRVWGGSSEGGAKGLRRVIPAHWAKCSRCRGSGKLACSSCRGKGTVKCQECDGAKKLRCETCRGRPVARTCTACDGAGDIACPRCLGRKPTRPEDPDSERDAEHATTDKVTLQDLHWAASTLEASTLEAKAPLRPMLALAHIGRLDSSLAIIVLRDAIGAKHRWVRAMALTELDRFTGQQLAEIGGRALVWKLIAHVRGRRNESTTALASALLGKLHNQYPRTVLRSGGRGPWRLIGDDIPEGEELPLHSPSRLASAADAESEARRSRSRSGTVVVTKPRFKGSDVARRVHFGTEAPGLGSLDLIWAIDCSGSVEHSFRHVLTTTREAAGFYAELLGSARFGLVAYRDVVVAQLTLDEELERLERALGKLRAKKGGGYDEGVDAALEAAFDAREMKWRPRSRVAVVVVGDSGPARPRADELVAAVATHRKEIERLRVHCVAVTRPGQSSIETPFFRKLAAAGGGQLVGLSKVDRTIAELGVAILADLDRKIVGRALSVAMRVEGRRLR